MSPGAPGAKAGAVLLLPALVLVEHALLVLLALAARAFVGVLDHDRPSHGGPPSWSPVRASARRVVNRDGRRPGEGDRAPPRWPRSGIAAAVVGGRRPPARWAGSVAARGRGRSGQLDLPGLDA